MLNLLPVELLEVILSHVHNKAHLLALSRVSRRIRPVIFTRLFEALAVKQRNEYNLWNLHSHPYFDKDCIAHVPEVLTVIKEIRFEAPFANTGFEAKERCSHSADDLNISMIDTLDSEAESHASDASDDGSIAGSKYDEVLDQLYTTEREDYGRIRLAKKIARLLSALPDDQLTSFRWDLGTCFPLTILCKNGYLVHHQRQIAKLSLITPMDCESVETPSLEQFTNVQELTWKGLLNDKDFGALRELFNSNHQKFTSLELDLVNWDVTAKLNNLPTPWQTPLMDLLRPKRLTGHRDFFPNLQSLSLSAVSLHGSLSDTRDPFNICGVQKLRLLNCTCARLLLGTIALNGSLLQATEVELVIGNLEEGVIGDDELNFLGAFQHLKDLFLMFESSLPNEDYIESILRHQDTLRRLVFHRRGWCITADAPCSNQYEDTALEEECGLARIFRQNNLESVGVCAEPSVLLRCLESVAPSATSLRILHLRFTGRTEPRPRFHPSQISDDFWEEEALDWRVREFSNPDIWDKTLDRDWRRDEQEELEDFANWAFGPNGFPCLQVLASGDFSHGNRFIDSRTLWCRNHGSTLVRWRPVQRNDVAENELIDANVDMLSACPVSPLYYRYGDDKVFPGLS